VDGTGTSTSSSRYNLPIGGQARLIMNAEVQMPFPGTGVDRSLRWFTFLDAGQVFNPQDGQHISLGDLRYSTFGYQLDFTGWPAQALAGLPPEFSVFRPGSALSVSAWHRILITRWHNWGTC